MKVKATVNFAGEICMAVGEVRDVPEGIAAPLLECSYIEALGADGSDEGRKDNTASGQLTIEQLKKMKRADLNDLAAKMGIDDPASFRNAGELAEAISKLTVKASDGGNEE